MQSTLHPQIFSMCLIPTSANLQYVFNNNNKFSLFHNSHVADTPQTTSVMIYIESVHRKRFVNIISLNQPKYTVDDQGSARP